MATLRGFDSAPRRAVAAKVATTRAGLRRSTSRLWSAVAVDVFHGVEIPEAILTSDIAGLLGRAVEPGGLIVWNVADSPTSYPAR
jgi:hypothetical protein